MSEPLYDPGASQKAGAGTAATVFAAGHDPRMASVVRLETGSRRGGGFYVEPRLVVTTADLVSAASVIDVTTSDGEQVLGLVVHTDVAHNLAVVHVPRSGPPAAFFDGPGSLPAERAQVLELLGHDRARLTLARLERAAATGVGTGSPDRFDLDLAGAPVVEGAPVFLDERAIGLVASPDGGTRHRFVQIEAVAALLESEALAALR